MQPTTDLRHYIRTYPDALDDALISDLMALPGTIKMDEDWRRCSITPVTGEVLERFIRVVRGIFADYRKVSSTLSFCTRIELPNVLRYEVSTPDRPEWFHEHSDSWDVRSATRQVSVVAYLNDVAQGGETVFESLDVSQRCKKGSILFFPSGYQYHHSARPPESNEKVVVVTWLHFGNNGEPAYTSVPLG